MRCLACDTLLSSFEATRKYTDTHKYVDLCNHCFATIESEVEVESRFDLMHEEDNECLKNDDEN